MERIAPIDIPAPTEVFKLWFASDTGSLKSLATMMQPLAFDLLVLFFIVSIAIFAMKAFEGLDLQERLWTFMLCVIFIILWPILVTSLKEVVDGLNGYLQSFFDLKNFSQQAVDRGLIEEMSLRFSAPELNQADPNDPNNEGLLDLIRNLGNGKTIEWMRVTGAHWILGAINSFLTSAAIASRVVVQMLYNIYFYLYLLLGPLVIARAVFSENLEAFLELLKEFVVLLLWPSMYVILAGTLAKTWGGNEGTFFNSISGIHIQLGLTIAFIILTFLIPPMTKKFAVALGTSIVTPFLRFGGIAMGLGLGQSALGVAGRALGIAHVPHLSHSAEKYISLGEIVHEHQHAEHLHHAAHNLHHTLHHAQHALHHAHGGHDEHHDEHGHDEHGHGDHGHEGHDDHGHGGHHDDHGHGGHGGHASHGGHEEHHDAGHEGGHDEHPLPTLVAETPGPHFQNADKKVKSLFNRFKWQRNSTKADEAVNKLDPVEPDAELSALREKATQYLAAKNSDKMTDMTILGIDHQDLESNEAKVITAYLKKVKNFHIRYGWLYDFEGRFWGTETQRPTKEILKKDREAQV